MMNEARIGVGMAATMLGMAGYEASLAYARQRSQGRPITGAGKDPAQPPVAIIDHADIKRMLLAQKAYSEGALALELYCARLVDEAHTGAPESAAAARLLLEVLTPIAKSWPSEWCLEANSLAIQVLGGYGYTRDFPVEQYWRDNRLNMIHEGTHGIQALDLLGRKVVMQDGAGSGAAGRAHGSDDAACRSREPHWPSTRTAWVPRSNSWSTRRARPGPPACPKRPWPMPRPICRPLAMWCWPGSGWRSAWPRPPPPAADTTEAQRHAGLLAALRYFHAYELPKIGAWLAVVARRESVCREMQDAWF